MRRRAVITAKKGCIVRAGLELDSEELATLPPGAAVDVLDTRENSKGTQRAKVVVAGAREGWVSAKTIKCDAVATVRIRHCGGGMAG